MEIIAISDISEKKVNNAFLINFLNFRREKLTYTINQMMTGKRYVTEMI